MIDALFLISPLAERSNFTPSAERTCLQHLVSGKLSLFFPVFFFLFYCVVLCHFFQILVCIYRESSEEDDEAVEAMAEIDKFEDSLKQKEIIKPE